MLVTDSDVDREELAADVISLVREKKGSVYAPKTVTFVDAIPLTSVGKYDKKALIATLGTS